MERKTFQEGVSVKLVRVWFKGVSGKARVNDVLSSLFETKVGVRQGDILSPLLFNIFINGIVQKVKEDRVRGLTNSCIALYRRHSTT
jgi:hypothetical protein